ncbi:metallophosphoesterase family protein [Vibrio sp. 624788]|uniref:metallophosphoesterase family protein n=1 Tax=Vibrio sp. 624788 TaxID=1234362 RepID=UPI0002F39A42|nr:metallophosphoesterase family protein [Vibrio sp. 624788]
MEKYAVLSDIHSNVCALKAVVEDARSKGVTKFVNLGDIFYGPLAPRETYDYLCGLDAITISGNQDRQIYQSSASEVASNPTMQFILDELGEAPLEWMRALPFDLEITDEIYACHGTPDDDLIYLLEDVTSGHASVRTEVEIRGLLGQVSSKIILCGHTHTPRCVELSTGQIVINPGSVGLQAYADDEPIPHIMQNYTPRASYVILEKQDSEVWDILFCRVKYDVNTAIEQAKARNRTDWVTYLKTGRCE